MLASERLFPLRKQNNVIRYVQSPLTRAKETAEIIMEELNSSVDTSRVRGFTPLHVETNYNIAEGFPCMPDPPTHQLSPRELDPKRIDEGFHDVFRVPPGTDPMNVSTEIYVCHANVIRYFTLRALQLNPQAWLRLTLPHAGVVWLTIDCNGLVTSSPIRIIWIKFQLE